MEELSSSVRQLQLERAAILEGTDPQLQAEQRRREELTRRLGSRPLEELRSEV